MSFHNNLPHFIIIGAMKGGTTSLYSYLNSHPSICMSRNKETNYFTEAVYKSHSLSWYQEQFSGDGFFKGEASPNYSKCHNPAFQGVAERIYKTLPQVKLIYILRDPLRRILSEMHHSGYSGELSFDTTYYGFYFKYPEIHPAVKTSCYYFQLIEYLRFFSLEQILILTTEELAAQPIETMNKLFKFIGVESDINKIDLQKKHHKSTEKQKATKIGKRLQQLGLHKRSKFFLSPSQYEWLRSQFFRKNASTPPFFSSELEKTLKIFLKNDTDKLRKLLNREFKDWVI